MSLPGITFYSSRFRSFSTRAKVPYILKEDGQTRFFDGDYEFVPGKDETILEGTAGYVVSFGEMLYRSLDAVLRCREQGLDVGLINKPTLNFVDEQVAFPDQRLKFISDLFFSQTTRKIGSSPFVLVVESLNQKTGVRRSHTIELLNVSDEAIAAWFQVWDLAA